MEPKEGAKQVTFRLLMQVAYYLKHKGGLDVLICACDTFRAGAVEQLKTHSRRDQALGSLVSLCSETVYMSWSV